MKEIFKFFVLNTNLGELQKANYYDEDFATLEFKKDGKLYSISLRCEGTGDGNF